MRVLITRPANQAAPLVECIEANGGHALVHPVISIVPPEDDRALREAAARVCDYQWVLFTSANAVHALMDRTPPLDSFPATACVGEATARALQTRGIQPQLVPSEFTADGLFDALLAHLGGDLRDRRFLFPQAAGGRDTLTQGLRERGARVDVVIAYRTAPHREEREALLALIATRGVDVLTFASPSAVDYFNLLVKNDNDSICTQNIPTVCIGPITAQRARSLGYNVQAVSKRADVDGILDALVSIAQTTA